MQGETRMRVKTGNETAGENENAGQAVQGLAEKARERELRGDCMPALCY